jgi:hypothetical protein
MMWPVTHSRWVTGRLIPLCEKESYSCYILLRLMWSAWQTIRHYQQPQPTHQSHSCQPPRIGLTIMNGANMLMN